MKMCLDCEHLEVSMVESNDERIPKIFRRFLRLYCKQKQHDVVGYDEQGRSTYCEHFKKRNVKRNSFER